MEVFIIVKLIFLELVLKLSIFLCSRLGL